MYYFMRFNFFFSQTNNQDKVVQAKQNVQQAKQRQSVTEHTTAEGITYSFSDKGVQFSGELKGTSTDYLMPQIYYNKQNKMYTCGSQQSFNESHLRTNVDLNLRSLIIENYIYKDVQKRAQQGETLSKAEQAFQAQHIKNLEREGIVVTKDGKLQQQNPRYPAQKVQENVSTGYSR